MIKPAEVERVTQRLDEDLAGDLTQHPSKIQRWFTDNIFQRALAYLVGFTEGGKAVRIKATGDGKLKVVTAGGGFTEYQKVSGTALDSYDATTTHTFKENYSRADFLIEGNDTVVSFLMENNVWGDDITLKVGYHSIDFVFKGVRIKNRTGGATANYEIVVYK